MSQAGSASGGAGRVDLMIEIMNSLDSQVYHTRGRAGLCALTPGNSDPLGQEPPVHDDRLARRVARGGAQQVDRRPHQLVRIAEARQRRVLLEPRAPWRAFDQRAVQVGW